MYIQTKRLELKPIGMDQLAPLTELLTDATVGKTYMLPDFAHRAEAEVLAKRLMSLSEDPERNVTGIFLEDRFIGLLNETEHCDSSVEVGYALLPRYHNCGYATEALTAAIGYFFDRGFDQVLAGAFEENAASIRVMVKSGMQQLDRQDTVAYRGQDRRCVYYGICKL